MTLIATLVQGIVQVMRVAQPPPVTGSAQLLSIDSRLCVDSQNPVGAVLSISVVPDGLHGEGEAFAGDGAGDHVLIVDVEIDFSDGLAVVKTLVDLLLQGLHSLNLLSFDGLVDDLGAEIDSHQLAGRAMFRSPAIGVSAGAERWKCEKTGQLFTNVGLAQIVAGIERGKNHLGFDGALEVVLDGSGEGEDFGLDGGDSHGVIGLTGVSIGANATLMQGIGPET